MEFMHLHIWYNVNSSNNYIGFDLNDAKNLAMGIPPEFYESKDHKNKSFSYSSVTKRMHIKVKNLNTKGAI